MLDRHGSLHAVVLCWLLGCSSDVTPPVEPESPDSDEEAEVEVRGDASRPRSDGSTPARDARVDVQPVPVDAGTVRDAGSSALDAAPQPADTGVADSGKPSQGDAGALARFSFFVASFKAMKQLSGSQNGFGGDLRHGETGDGAGLRGADKICTEIAEQSMPGSGAKTWRAFLSATKGGASGGAVNAIERIGDGPWYDRRARLVGNSKADLTQTRPNADAMIKNDLPNEDGVPNHNPDGTGNVDNHHVLTGSAPDGKLYASDVKATCNDWTKSQPDQADAPRVGLSWPRGGGGGGGGANGSQWISAMDESGCGAGASLVEAGGPVASNPTVGSGGGYGAIYCFALTP